MKSVRIIKQGKNDILTGIQPGRDDPADRQSTRQVVRTVKGWITELHQRRRDEEIASSAFRKLRVTLLVITLSLFGLETKTYGQQLKLSHLSGQEGGPIPASRLKPLSNEMN